LYSIEAQKSIIQIIGTPGYDITQWWHNFVAWRHKIPTISGADPGMGGPGAPMTKSRGCAKQSTSNTGVNYHIKSLTFGLFCMKINSWYGIVENYPTAGESRTPSFLHNLVA